MKSYICKHGSLIEQAGGTVLSRRGLAAVHAGASNFKSGANKKFAREVVKALLSSKVLSVVYTS